MPILLALLVAAASPPPYVNLSIEVRDGRGNSRDGQLVCRADGSSRLSGYLRGENGRPLCRLARSRARFLASQPDPERICTFVYGGPQTARIRGRIGARRVGRRFARRDGCEIGDWDRVDALLRPGLR